MTAPDPAAVNDRAAQPEQTPETPNESTPQSAPLQSGVAVTPAAELPDEIPEPAPEAVKEAKETEETEPQERGAVEEIEEEKKATLAPPANQPAPSFPPYPLKEAQEFVATDMQSDFKYKYASPESLLTIRKSQEEAYIACFVTMEAIQNKIKAQLALIEEDGGLEKMNLSRKMSLSHSGNDALNVQMVRLANSVAQAEVAMDTIDKHILALKVPNNDNT